MYDRDIEQQIDEVPAMPDVLQAVLSKCIEEARAKLEAGEEVVPFTAVAVGDTLFTETHPCDSFEECAEEARRTVQGLKGAAAYGFCYDGYTVTSAGEQDAVIAEGAVPGDEEAVVLALYYTLPQGEDGPAVFSEETTYVGPAPNYMQFTPAAGQEEFEDDPDVG